MEAVAEVGAKKPKKFAKKKSKSDIWSRNVQLQRNIILDSNSFLLKRIFVKLRSIEKVQSNELF